MCARARVCVCVCNRLRIAADCVQQLQHHCLLVEGRVGGLQDAEEDRGEEDAKLALKVRLKDQQQRNEYLHHVSIRQLTSGRVSMRREEGGGQAHAQFALKVCLKDQQQRNEYHTCNISIITYTNNKCI